MADTTTNDAAKTAFLQAYQGLRENLPGGDYPWLRDLRDSAITGFSERGLPTPKLESWKYTNLRDLRKLSLATDPRAGEHISIDRAPSLLPGGAACHRLVFVSGTFRADLSNTGNLPPGVELRSLADCLESDPGGLEGAIGGIAGENDQALLQLNTALATDGFVLRLKAGTVLPLPIEIVHLSGANQELLAFHPRNLVVLEEGCQATLIENHCSLGRSASFGNFVTEISLAQGATLHHFKVQSESGESFHLATGHIDVGRNAHYDSFSLTIGSRLSRNETNVRLSGEGGQCHLNGAYLVRNTQHCDNTTVIEHLVPHTTCHEVFKGVIDDKARAVFQGQIIVHRNAQKANGHQLSKALLLSDQAEIDHKPELKIYADDVMCSHGATAGDLDHDALFYLRSRGLPEAKARSMLIEAFLAETIGEISAEGLCPALMASIGHWLADAERDIAL